MRVLCIVDNDYVWILNGKIVPGPKYMEECMVIGEDIENGNLYYILAEYYCITHIRHKPSSFRAKWFIPLEGYYPDTTEELEALKEEICE